MSHPVWPLFDLRVVTPRLELRAIDDDMGVALAQLASRGIHDPGFMPFAVEWTDVQGDELLRNTMQYYWRCRADWSAASWSLNLAVVVDGEVVGTTGLMGQHFPELRQFETGSWLGREFQGRGIGTEMRMASLQLGFAGLDARVATTVAFDDNPSSLGVTGKLGYVANGRSRRLRRGAPATSLHFEMSRAHWEANVRRDDITIHGLEGCLPLFGL
ncbi:MAG: GNAT family protein [Actinobacteria bacterium]|nr:GNAT family protein [Actinomycetota bacterium]